MSSQPRPRIASQQSLCNAVSKRNSLTLWDTSLISFLLSVNIMRLIPTQCRAAKLSLCCVTSNFVGILVNFCSSLLPYENYDPPGLPIRSPASTGGRSHDASVAFQPASPLLGTSTPQSHFFPPVKPFINMFKLLPETVVCVHLPLHITSCIGNLENDTIS